MEKVIVERIRFILLYAGCSTLYPITICLSFATFASQSHCVPSSPPTYYPLRSPYHVHSILRDSYRYDYSWYGIRRWHRPETRLYDTRIIKEHICHIKASLILLVCSMLALMIFLHVVSTPNGSRNQIRSGPDTYV
jgi:hypothetical protein